MIIVSIKWKRALFTACLAAALMESNAGNSWAQSLVGSDLSVGGVNLLQSGNGVFGNDNKYWPSGSGGGPASSASLIVGTSNSVESVLNSILIGTGNWGTSVSNSVLVGYGQSLADGTAALFGSSNVVSGASASFVSGHSNMIIGSVSGLVAGTDNYAWMLDNSLVSGTNNNVGDAGYSLIGGMLNSSYADRGTLVFGTFNMTYTTECTIVAGINNNIDNLIAGAVFGRGLVNSSISESHMLVGTFNAPQSTTKAPRLTVGNGTGAAPSQRSNAFVVYADGDVVIPKRQGDILMGEFGN